MAKQRHVAATEVTVAPLAEATGFEKFVQSYWKHGIVLFVLVAAGVVGRHTWAERQREAEASQWATFNDAVRPGGGIAEVRGGVDELRALASDATKETAPWALLALASKLETENDFAGALEAVARLEREHPQHSVVTAPVTIGTRTTTLVADLKERLTGLAAISSELPRLFTNPEPPADAPRVRLSTSKGDIVVALYPNVAPKHVENFLGVADSGKYDGTKFHRVMDGFMIQGGDRNSIDGAPETWGTGDAGYTIPQEFGELVHFPGFLAMAKKPNEIESSGDQFYITLGSAHHLNGVHTVFGKVVEGMDVVRAIGSAPNQPNSDRPADPVVLTKASKL